MNRLASVLAGTVTTVLSGAAIGGAAFSQGIFDGGAQASPSAADTWEAPATQAATVEATWTAEPTAAVQPQQRIVYVDKDPVVITRDVRVPAPAVAATQESGSPAPSASPSATASPTSAPTAAPAPPSIAVELPAPAQKPASAPAPSATAPAPTAAPAVAPAAPAPAPAVDDRGGQRPAGVSDDDHEEDEEDEEDHENEDHEDEDHDEDEDDD